MSECNADDLQPTRPAAKQSGASIKLYRCHHPRCLQDTKQQGMVFVCNDKAVKCPSCGTANDHSRIGHLVNRLTVVHFNPPHDAELMIGQNVWACDSARSIQSVAPGANTSYTPHMGTGDPRAVTCPACKETPEYTSAAARFED